MEEISVEIVGFVCLCVCVCVCVCVNKCKILWADHSILCNGQSS